MVPFPPAVQPFAAILFAGLPLKVVCAWCSSTMREGVQPTSHSICPPCLARLDAEATS